MDQIDHKILRELQFNARLSNADLAAQAFSKTECAK